MSFLKRFFLPELNSQFLLRVIVVSFASYLVFTFLLIPLKIRGKSMEPTYHDGSYALCWRPKYGYTSFKRFDVVTVRLAGRHVMLLKRIIAFAGESLEFRHGVLFINSRQIDEPYVQFNSDWNLLPRTVAEGKVYVIGDNRGLDMKRHVFGQVNMQRIVGGVVP